MTSVCVLLLLPPPESTLFPYTTLFRSQAKQKQRYREGAHCQHGADLLAKQIGEDEGQEFHEAPTSFLAASTRAPFSDRKSTRLNSSHRCISYAVFCLKKKKKNNKR